MKLALFNTACGILLVHWIGRGFLALEPGPLWGAILASIAGGFLSVLATTRLETSFLGPSLRGASIRIWLFHSAVYFGVLLLCAPVLREVRTFLALILPLLAVTGVAIVAFGPIQDRLVARSQRKARESAHSMR